MTRAHESELAAQQRRIDAMEATLKSYQTQLCEGWCKDANRIYFDDCGGCKARRCLEEVQ